MNSMNHAAKIVIYTADDEFRYIDLWWNERTDSAIIKENGRTTTILVKTDATLNDALVALGYDHTMKVEFPRPSIQLASRRDFNDYLNRMLLTCENERIIMSQANCEFAGNPAMVGW